MSAASLPPSLIPPELREEFNEWVSDAGYTQDELNRWDSRSREIERLFLEERVDGCGPCEIKVET